MTRRDLLPLALLAVPELTAPSTADERLTAAVEAWGEAEFTLADLRQAYFAAGRQLRTARNVPAHRLRILAESRRQAKEEMAAGERALAEAEARMDAAARLRGDG